MGALDVTTPPALARALAKGIPKARLVEIPGCAHCPPIEQPEKFAREVGNFLSGWTPWKAAARDVFLNIAGFIGMFLLASGLAVGVRTVLEKLLGLGLPRLALVFALVAGAVWATLFGLTSRKALRNPEGKVLPLVAAGVVLGGTVVWVYIFAGASYVLMQLGEVQYVPPGKRRICSMPSRTRTCGTSSIFCGVNITTALGWRAR